MILVLTKKIFLYHSVVIILCILFITLFTIFLMAHSDYPVDIVIDPGHGGIDGGTTNNGILEKEINLSIAKKLKTHLEAKGYKVVLTRDKDISLEKMSSLSGGRHVKDLNARVSIINKSNAKLFLSIHMNCQLKDAGADGSYVLYSDKLPQNKAISYCIQRALNSIVIDGQKRTIHNPQTADFYILRNTKVPGALIEAAFLSNDRERELLLTDDFRETISKSIANGIEQFLNEPSNTSK